MKLKITFLLIILATLFSCGSDDEDEQLLGMEEQLLGKYILASFESVNCDDPSLDQSLIGGSDGACETVDGQEFCIVVCFTFTETTFDYSFAAKVDGVTAFDFTGSDIYDPTVENFTFCPPESVCTDVTVSADKETITFVGTDEDNCEFVMVIERA